MASGAPKGDRRAESIDALRQLRKSVARTTRSGLTVADGVLGLVGGTPLVRLRRLAPSDEVEIWAKAEWMNAGGSVKDRPALSMISRAEAAGQLRPGATIVEATSGNTGISLAMVSAIRGYRCVLVMPEDMSLERRYILRAYGADIVLTPPEQAMSGAVARARQLLEETPGAFMPSQFENLDNPLAHEATTGEEIVEQMGGAFEAFVSGVGTGGTISGVARALRGHFGDALKIVAVEPALSSVLSGGEPGLHGIQGIGAGFVPDTLDQNLIDEVVRVADLEAQRMTERLAREEGLLVGPSSGANVHAAVEFAKRLGKGRVVTVLCDSGERYLF